MKTTCRKSWPGNIFHMLNLTFDPCFKVKWGRYTKTLFLPYYLPPAAEGRGWEIIKCLPYVRPSVRSSRFCINLNISFIYKDIFTKFAGDVYGYENLSLQNFSLIFKNKMAAIANCLKIIKVL